ncbi:cytosine deaminase, partial [Endobacter medicaginis]|nr:cytosine deaminase [Endobacter medicaginis]
LAIGAPADLVGMAARSASEFLARPGAERVVLRAGQVLDAALPDYETLDDLSGQTAGA